MKILGHRGINQPENIQLPYQNTLEAFSYALKCGADGVEFDVIASRDGKCFVIHDEDISKHSNFSTGIINELDSSEISSKYAGKATKYKIPSFQEVLDIFKGTNKTLNIEIKQKGIAELVLNELAESKTPLDNIVISSFNHADIIKARSLNNKVTIGILFGKESRENRFFEQYANDLAERLAPSAFMMEKTLSYLSILESSHEKYFWTIKKEDMENLLLEGLMMYNNISLITDYPAELVEKLAQKGK